MNAPVRPDDPADECLLERDGIATDLYARILQCEHCQVFGVFGDWGSGKTSFLKHVREKLEAGRTPDRRKQQPSTVLWFEAWRCSADEKPVVALLHEIRRALAWNEGLRSKLGTAALTVARRGATLVLGAITGQLGMKPGDFSAPHSDPLPAEIIREQLESAIATLLDARKCARLVIMIDDLDRCHAAAAMKLLEGIKIYLNLKQCVFVLGLNAREVQRSVEQFLPGTDDADHRSHRAAEYLEKICNYPVRLPYFRPGVQAAVVQCWLRPFLGETAAGALARIVEVHQCLPPNPRKMKVWANAVLHLTARNFPVLTRVAPHAGPGQDQLQARDNVAGQAAVIASLPASTPSIPSTTAASSGIPPSSLTTSNGRSSPSAKAWMSCPKIMNSTSRWPPSSPPTAPSMPA